MSVISEVHESHGATYLERGGRQVVDHYGRPERTHVAVRNGVGVMERAEDILVISGDDRIEYVDNAVSNVVPQEDGHGCYALLLNPQGRIRTDLYVYNAGGRLLVVLPPGQGEPLAEEWQEKTFIQDVDIRLATEEFGIFGVHGPTATEKVASVLTEGTPQEPLSFVRGSMGDAGVTVVRSDAPTGETGYDIICEREAARDVFDSLENRGLNAVPVGYQTWETLTLEAGTPLFESELAEELPNDFDLGAAVDYEKGCFVGQEVVSRIANRGQPAQRLVGLQVPTVPDRDATVFDGDETVGAVTRACESPSLDRAIALALVDRTVGEVLGQEDALAVRVGEADRPATPVSLPFVEGSERSARAPHGGTNEDG